jgi:hypothetical protein
MSVAVCLNAMYLNNKIYREDFEEVMLFCREMKQVPCSFILRKLISEGVVQLKNWTETEQMKKSAGGGCLLNHISKMLNLNI